MYHPTPPDVGEVDHSTLGFPSLGADGALTRRGTVRGRGPTTVTETILDTAHDYSSSNDSSDENDHDIMSSDETLVLSDVQDSPQSTTESQSSASPPGAAAGTGAVLPTVANLETLQRLVQARADHMASLHAQELEALLLTLAHAYDQGEDLHSVNPHMADVCWPEHTETIMRMARLNGLDATRVHRGWYADLAHYRRWGDPHAPGGSRRHQPGASPTPSEESEAPDMLSSDSSAASSDDRPYLTRTEDILDDRVCVAQDMVARRLQLPSGDPDPSGGTLSQLLSGDAAIRWIQEDPIRWVYQVQHLPDPMVVLTRLPDQTRQELFIAVGHTLKREVIYRLLNQLPPQPRTPKWIAEWLRGLDDDNDYGIWVRHAASGFKWGRLLALMAANGITADDARVIEVYATREATITAGCSAVVLALYDRWTPAQLDSLAFAVLQLEDDDWQREMLRIRDSGVWDLELNTWAQDTASTVAREYATVFGQPSPDRSDEDAAMEASPPLV